MHECKFAVPYREQKRRSPFGAKRKKMSTEKRIKKKTLLELNKYSNQSELIFVLWCVFSIMCLKMGKRTLKSTPSPGPLINLFYVLLFH